MINMNDKFYTTKDKKFSSPILINNEEDNILITVPTLKKWLLINSATSEILKRCDGIHTVQDIINDLKIIYTNVSTDEIVENVLPILEILYSQKLIFKSQEECNNNIEIKNKDPFSSLYIEITSKCNLKCKHCFGNFENTSYTEINTNKILSVLNEAKKLGADSVILSGGEPLLHQSFIEICTKALEMDFNTIISTNGLLINEEILEMFQKWPKLKIQFSLEGINKDTHEALRGHGSFIPTMNALSLLINSGFANRISISTTIFKQNVSEIELIIKWCIDNKIRKIAFKKLFKQGRADCNWNNLILNEDSNIVINFFTSTLRNILDKYRDSISIDGCPTEESFSLDGLINLDYPCPLGSSIRIDSEGKVYPCQLLNTNEFIIGNIYNNSLKEILEGESLKKLFSLAQLRMSKIDKCSNCTFVHFCGGGCMAQALLDYGTVYSEYPYCNYRHSVLNKKLLQSAAE